MIKYEIYRKRFIKGKDIYECIIDEVRYPGVRRKAKFYSIEKNGKDMLSTSLHQTWYKYQRDLGLIK
jgi:hypothetical protein